MLFWVAATMVFCRIRRRRIHCALKIANPVNVTVGTLVGFEEGTAG